MRIAAALALLVLVPACGDESHKGTDPLGGSEAPTVRIVTPGPRTKCHRGSTINIHAVAIDPDTVLLRVDFFDGSELIGSRVAAPFIIPWGAVAKGAHVLSAVATDVDGLSTVSAPVTVVVIDAGEDHDDDDDDRDPRHQRRRR